MPVKPIPDGHSTVIPYLCVSDVARLIQFLEQTFDAKEMYRTTLPTGAIMHAHVHIGTSSVMMGQVPPDYAAMKGMLYVYVTDVDAVYARALAAGGTSISGPSDQFYGDRVAAVKDPFDNQWWIATHKEDVPNDELVRRAATARGASDLVKRDWNIFTSRGAAVSRNPVHFFASLRLCAFAKNMGNMQSAAETTGSRGIYKTIASAIPTMR